MDSHDEQIDVENESRHHMSQGRRDLNEGLQGQEQMTHSSESRFDSSNQDDRNPSGLEKVIEEFKTYKSKNSKGSSNNPNI